jgi:integrase/recombinase XerD
MAIAKKNKTSEVEVASMIQSLQKDFGIDVLRKVIKEHEALLDTTELLVKSDEKADNLSLLEALEQFKESTGFATYTDATKTTYNSIINELLNYSRITLSDKKGPDTRLNDFNFKLFLMEFVDETTQKYTTANKKVAFLRAWLKFIFANEIRQGIFDLNFLPLNKIHSNEPKSLKPRQIQELLALSRQGSNNLRNYTLLWVFLGSGIRIGEVGSLQIKHIDPTTQSIMIVPMKIRGKKIGSRQREKRKINKAALAILMDYIVFTYGHLVDEDDYGDKYLFSKNEGKTSLNTRTVSEIVKGLIKRAKTLSDDEKERYSTHTLRHTFAMTGLDSGVDIYMISKLMGHKSIKSTEQYLKLYDEQLIEAVNRNPFGHINFKSNMEI